MTGVQTCALPISEHLPAHIREGNNVGFTGLSITGTDSFNLCPGQSLHDALAEAEARYVEQAMQQARGNVTLAAEILRIPRQTLQYKLRTKK